MTRFCMKILDYLYIAACEDCMKEDQDDLMLPTERELGLRENILCSKVYRVVEICCSFFNTFDNMHLGNKYMMLMMYNIKSKPLKNLW